MENTREQALEQLKRDANTLVSLDKAYTLAKYNKEDVRELSRIMDDASIDFYYRAMTFLFGSNRRRWRKMDCSMVIGTIRRYDLSQERRLIDNL